MDGKYIIIVLFLCSIIHGCIGNATHEVSPTFISVHDSKPCTDSIYNVWKEHIGKNAVNPRFVQLYYYIKNTHDSKMYIPFRTWLDDTYESSIKAVLIKDNDTICPLINVSKCYKTHYINPGDSMYIEVKLFNFEEWDKNEYYVNNDVDSLLSRLRLQYCKSPKDEVEGYDIPDIKFGNKPKIYYVIPRGGNIDPV